MIHARCYSVCCWSMQHIKYKCESRLELCFEIIYFMLIQGREGAGLELFYCITVLKCCYLRYKDKHKKKNRSKHFLTFPLKVFPALVLSLLSDIIVSGCGVTNVWCTWQSSDNVLLLPLPGQLVLSGGTRILLGLCDCCLVIVTTSLIRDVVYLHRLTFLHHSLAGLHQHTHLQQVLGPPTSDLF